MEPEAALKIHVEEWTGPGALLKRFRLNRRAVEIAENIDVWQGADYRYFKVKGEDGNLYIIAFR